MALVNNKIDSLVLNMNDAIDKVLADDREGMLKDGSAIAELKVKYQNIFKAIGKVFNKIISKLKTAFDRVEISSPEAVALKI